MTAKEKNIYELIRYYKRLDMENTFFIILGGGLYLEILKKITFSENIPDKVIFTVAVEPVNIDVYYRGDIFLSASQSETQGLIYIKALTSDLSAVCRIDNCLNDVITDGIKYGQYTDFNEFSELIKKHFL